jgi:hypothetical protein
MTCQSSSLTSSLLVLMSLTSTHEQVLQGTLSGGKIVEAWDFYDGLGLLRQLGALPTRVRKWSQAIRALKRFLGVAPSLRDPPTRPSRPLGLSGAVEAVIGIPWSEISAHRRDPGCVGKGST